MTGSTILGHLLAASRSVIRRGRHARIALSAIAFGVIALLIAGGFIGWVLSEMRELSIRTWYGHVQVARTGYWEEGAADPSRFLVRQTPDAVSALSRDSRVTAVAPRVRFSGLASHGDATLSFLGEGVAPGEERKFGRSLIFLPGRGQGLAEDDENAAVVGQGLAANLGVKLGDSLVLMTNTAGGGVNAVEVRIRGIFLTANKAFDDATLRIPLPLARRLMRTDGTHAWIVLLRESADTARVVAEIGRAGAAAGLEARPWTRLADTYLKTEALFGKQLGAMALVLGLMIVLGISNTMTMSVMERTSEIGTAMALGATRRHIMAQFIAEGVVLGAAGASIGVALGIALAALLSWIGIPLPPPPGLDTPIVAAIRVDVSLVLQAFLVAVASTVIASVLPARRASRMIIVDALRQARA